jgi:hypothetical protein
MNDVTAIRVGRGLLERLLVEDVKEGTMAVDRDCGVWFNNNSNSVKES